MKYWNSDRIHIVDTTLVTTIGNQTFAFVPYVPPGRFVEALNTAEGWESASAIFAHQEFQGCKMGAIISVEGDEWPLNHPYVVSGHIHDYQEPQPNILYTGTPIQHAFGDRHDKTISWFVFNTPTDREHTRIDLGLRRKQVINITCAEVPTYVPPEHFDLKIVIKGTAGEIKAIMQHLNIDVWKKAGHVIVYKAQSFERENSDIPAQPHSTMLFSSLLLMSVQSYPELKSIYTEIFGQHAEEQLQPVRLSIVSG
jgi:hypothetical protein